MPDTAIIDVDGTLVDSNVHHVLAWGRAFARHDLAVPTWRLLRALGMGGDKLVPAVAGRDVEARLGDELRAAWVEELDELIDGIQPLESATALLDALRDRGFRVVLASSGRQEHVEHFISLLDASTRCDAWTTAGDVEATKPAPELLQVALDKVGGSGGVVVGDSPYDFEAASRLGMPGVGVLTGGFRASELVEAGAGTVLDSPSDLLARLDVTPLSSPTPPA